MNRESLLARHAFRPVKGFASEQTQPQYAPDLRLEPTHLEIHAHLHIAESAANCRVITTVICRSPGHRTLTLDAMALHIQTVSDPDGHPLKWTYDGKALNVIWKHPIPIGENRRVEVQYRVEEPLTGLVFQRPSPAHPNRVPLATTDHETQRARYWIPCVDHPAVRTPLDMHIRSLDSHEILGTGALVSSTQHDDGTRTAHWSLQRKCPAYLLCIAVGELVRCEGGQHRGHPIAFFAPPPYTADDLARSFGPTAEMLDWMTERLQSPLPYPKYYQFAAPGKGGAMENISLVGWGDRWVTDERLHSELGWVVDLINVHEMAHTWFGDAVVIRDFAHAWLKESWATYIEVVWQEETVSLDEAHLHLAEKARAYCTESDERYARPIVTRHFESGWDMYDRHLYPGGAWRIHMLRNKLGDSVFWAAVADYLEKYTDEVVETDDFRRLLENHSGQSLAPFFDQWIHRPGYPKLAIQFQHEPEKQRSRLIIEQTQEDEKKGIGLFDFPLEVAVENDKGTWSRYSIQVDGKRQVLSWTSDTRAQQIIIDPDMRVLFQMKFQPGLDMSQRSLEQAPTVAGRLQAIQALGRDGSRAAILILEEAFALESRWGLRNEIARALGNANTYAAAGALARLLNSENDPKVMYSLCSAAGQYRDPRIAQALNDWLSRDERPYRAASEALTSLGKQHSSEYFSTLKRFVHDPGWWGWTRMGALMGLGHCRQPEAGAILRQVATNDAEPEQVRNAAIQAMGIYANWQDRNQRNQICEVMSDLCRDPIYNVRSSAGRALLSAGDQRHMHTIDTLCRQLALQDIPSFQRGKDRLGPDREISQTSALAETVSRLNARVLKLQNRIDELESDQKPPSTETA